MLFDPRLHANIILQEGSFERQPLWHWEIRVCPDPYDRWRTPALLISDSLCQHSGSQIADNVPGRLSLCLARVHFLDGLEGGRLDRAETEAAGSENDRGRREDGHSQRRRQTPCPTVSTEQSNEEAGGGRESEWIATDEEKRGNIGRWRTQ